MKKLLHQNWIKTFLDIDKYSQNLLRFIWPKYQILAKFWPKWVSGSENDSLSVSKYTELSSGISKLPCKTLCFLQKPKNRPKNVFIWPKYQIWSKFRPFLGLKTLKRSRLSPNKLLEELKPVERIYGRSFKLISTIFIWNYWL